MSDADYIWKYRCIGYSPNGSVSGTLIVETQNPPTLIDLRSIETTHEHLLAHPDVQTVTTFGPMRDRRR